MIMTKLDAGEEPRVGDEIETVIGRCKVVGRGSDMFELSPALESGIYYDAESLGLLYRACPVYRPTPEPEVIWIWEYECQQGGDNGGFRKCVGMPLEYQNKSGKVWLDWSDTNPAMADMAEKLTSLHAENKEKDAEIERLRAEIAPAKDQVADAISRAAHLLVSREAVEKARFAPRVNWDIRTKEQNLAEFWSLVDGGK